MARPRTNYPADVSNTPACVRDPEREAEIAAEFLRRKAYIAMSYHTALRFAAEGREFNEGLRNLKAAVSKGTPAGLSHKRLPRLLEMHVSRKARAFARERLGCEGAEINGADIKKAARWVAANINPVANRPAHDHLRCHVEGMAALMTETTGSPVRVGRYLNSVYEPHFKSGMSQILPDMFMQLDKTVTVIQLVNIVEKAHRRYGCEWPRFHDLFPLYGARSGADGSLIMHSGWRLERFEPNIPTYFH